jgi:hypothetical protein
MLAVAVVIVNGKSHCVRLGPALAIGSGIKLKTNDFDCSVTHGATGITYIVSVTEPLVLSIFDGIYIGFFGSAVVVNEPVPLVTQRIDPAKKLFVIVVPLIAY